MHAADGITTLQLHEDMRAFVESDHPLAPFVKLQAKSVLEGVAHLPLHPTVQLLLTTVHATRPHVYQHALTAMALAGSLSAVAGQSRFDLRLALLGGLLHDQGEMYINPSYLDTNHPLDAPGFRHLVTHPLIGRMLLVELTDYPAALGQSVAEHHERLDGTGYPARTLASAFSPLGQLQAVVEAAVGMASNSVAPLARTALALRLVPGEFDDDWTSMLVNAARTAREKLEEALPTFDSGQVLANVTELRKCIGKGAELASAIAASQTTTKAVRTVGERALHRFLRLQVAGNAMGLWTANPSEHSPAELHELFVAVSEMRYRLNGMQRECLWTESTLSASEHRVLQPLWMSIPKFAWSPFKVTALDAA